MYTRDNRNKHKWHTEEDTNERTNCCLSSNSDYLFSAHAEHNKPRYF